MDNFLLQIYKMLRFYRQKRNILFSDDGESLLSGQSMETSRLLRLWLKVGGLTEYRRTEHCTLKSCDAIVPAIIAVGLAGQDSHIKCQMFYELPCSSAEASAERGIREPYVVRWCACPVTFTT